MIAIFKARYTQLNSKGENRSTQLTWTPASESSTAMVASIRTELSADVLPIFGPVSVEEEFDKDVDPGVAMPLTNSSHASTSFTDNLRLAGCGC